MKKSTIVVVITAIVMITIGIGLCIGGAIAVGGLDRAREQLAEHGVHINSGFQIDVDRSKGTTASEERHVSGGEKAIFGIEDVDSLEFDVGAAKMEILSETSTEEISVQTDSNCDVYVKNGVLHVETDIDLENSTIIVEIPRNAVFQEVEFDIGAGEIFIEHISAQECSVNVGMGNFEYNGSILKYADIECGMGNVELYLEGNKEDYNYEIDCAAGNVDIGDYSIGGVAVEETINNHGNATIEIECGMGNVTVGF